MARTPLRDKAINHSFIYEAIIVSHLDPTYMGRLEVELLKSGASDALPQRTGQLMTVSYLSPFYGITSYEGMTENDSYRTTQQSYGFWAVPPDMGTKVLVVFAEGHTGKGYWIGCIQDEGMNFMVPDGRAATSNTTSSTPPELSGKKLPAGEYNKLTSTITDLDTTTVPRPYNFDFSQILEVQGLIDDEVRGTSTSSARREVPSMVFGISTPGPLDKRATATRARYGTNDKGTTNYSSRLGGSSFVMDDGDPNLVRATHAADGPPYYVNKRAGEEGGDETIPHNEGIRLRTRTGHQILLSNSEDLIYIGNSRGTAWIEMTSDGKIDVFANDSISFYTEQDFNFTSDRDINFDAGRNINMYASARWSQDRTHVGVDNIKSGEVAIMGRHSTSVRGGRNSSTILLDGENIDIKVETDIRIETSGEFHLKSGKTMYLDSSQDMNINSERNILAKSSNNFSVEALNLTNQISNDINTVVGSNINENIGANRNSVVQGNNSLKVNATNNTIVLGNDHSLYSGSRFSTTSGSSHSITNGSTFTSVIGDQNISVAGSAFNAVTGDQNSLVSGSTFSETLGDSNALVSGASYTTVSGDANIQGANINMDSTSTINQNSGASSPAMPGSPVTAPSAPQTTINVQSPNIALTGGSPLRSYGAAAPGPLGGFTSPRVIPGIDVREELEIITITKRVPQHEPWPHHENLDPIAFKPEFTDREIPGIINPADRITVPETLTRGAGPITRSAILDGTGGMFGVDGRPITPGRTGNFGTGGSYASPITDPLAIGTINGVTVNADGSINRGRAGPNFEASTVRGPGPRPIPGSGEDSTVTAGQSCYLWGVTPQGSGFGSGSGEAISVGAVTRSVQAELREIIQEAAAYARVNFEIFSGSIGRYSSSRHRGGWAADTTILHANGTPLSSENPKDLAIMINFVRAFRDAARGRGHRPSVGFDHGRRYMGRYGPGRFHLDLAMDKTVLPGSNAYNVFAWGDNNSAANQPCWIAAIMYGSGADDGNFTNSGEIIGVPSQYRKIRRTI